MSRLFQTFRARNLRAVSFFFFSLSLSFKSGNFASFREMMGGMVCGVRVQKEGGGYQRRLSRVESNSRSYLFINKEVFC